MSSDFKADPELQKFATEAADKCVDFIQQKFGKTADFSDVFVSEVEGMLHLMHLQMGKAKPSEKDLQTISTFFGSYLGETYRRNHGGEWGISNNTPALSFGSGFCSYPWARVYRRLEMGEEDNVHHWYVGLLKYASGDNEDSSLPPPLPLKAQPETKKGFLARLFGRG
jgi:hypothetical protein